MSFTSPIEMSFIVKNKNEIFGVPMQRAIEISEGIDDICRSVIRDESKFIIFGTGEDEGKHRLNEEGIFKLFLELAQNINEWAFIIYSANPVYESLHDALYRKKMVRELVDVLSDEVNTCDKNNID